MENSFTQKLCRILIGSAFQRCRISENLCRLTVSLKCCTHASNRPMIRISISDTGIASSLDEFQDMETVSTDKWGEFGYILGTEVSLSTYEGVDGLCDGIVHFLQKDTTPIPAPDSHGCPFYIVSDPWALAMPLRTYVFMLMLKIPKVAAELMVDCISNVESKSENLLLFDEGNCLPSPLSNIERLVSGLEDHVLKHGNSLDKQCESCFSSRVVISLFSINREQLKVGSGTACNSEAARNSGQIIEAVVIITELSEPPSSSCLMGCGTKTEDFLPSTIPQSVFNALPSIDWKSYGLSLRLNSVAVDGQSVLEWENLPPHSHIDISFGWYFRSLLYFIYSLTFHKIVTQQMRQKTHFDKNLVKKAVKQAMDDLKEKYAGTLLSAHAVKIQNYAPDLARTIAGLIFSSDDSEFQGECITLLGLQPQETGKEKVEDCITKKINAVIGMNDRKSQKDREPAPFLFEEDCIHEADSTDEEDEEEFDITYL
ncbi:hypothetical protein IFM89_035126 [Coptis chinensis]|uniref:Type 2 DNA topoisomerase 6 subunit B-like n=1 Tax=Coptis chinensis TaxID=261450 RepID=A0A835ITN9_9MAGN|nr:hypothetical protein IFM89_035126 [Coptis chinensis]